MSLFKEIEIYAGRRVVIPITYKVGGVAADITGYTFTLMVKDRLDKPNADSLLEVDAVLVAPLDGTMVLTLLETDTSSLEACNYFYDLTAYDPSGSPHYLEQGRVDVKTPVNLYE